MEINIVQKFWLREFYEKITELNIELNNKLIKDRDGVNVEITDNKHILRFKYNDIPITITIDFNELSITVSIYFNWFDNHIENLVRHIINILST